MKNSIVRRMYFSLSANLRFLFIGLKNVESFSYSNKFKPIFGRFWSYMYSKISGVNSDYYVPETFYYNNLERRVNDFSLATFFEHKGYLNDIIDTNTIPLIVNCISGIIYDKNEEVVNFSSITRLFHPELEYVVKRSVGTGGGKGVEIGLFSEIESTINEYYHQGYDFIVQPKINQHSELMKFNPTSLNTIRVLTLSYDGRVHTISTVFRMGNGGKVDNSAAGGISIGVDESGFLRNKAIDHNFRQYSSHPFSKIEFCDKHQLPFFNEIKAVIREKHKKIKSHGLVSWDVSVDDIGNISIIEFNVVWNELNFHQANNGPIFEEHYDYIKKFI